MADQLTEFQRKALAAIRDNGPEPVGTWRLARELWPGRNFRRPWLVVGAQVGKLANRGWVWREYYGRELGHGFRGYILTAAGRAALGESDE